MVRGGKKSLVHAPPKPLIGYKKKVVVLKRKPLSLKRVEKRIEKFFDTHLGQRYDKKFYGPLLLLEIGLPAIRTGKIEAAFSRIPLRLHAGYI